MRKLIAFCLLIMLISCQNTKKCTTETSNLITVDLEQVKEYELNQIFKNIEVAALETNDSSLLGHINKILVSANKVFISDKLQKTIIWFDFNGSYLGRLKKIGRGPDEFLDISDFEYNNYNNTLELTDARVLREYNLKGEMISRHNIYAQTKLFAHSIARIDPDRIAFLSEFDKAGAVVYSTKKKKVLFREQLFPEWQSDAPFFKGQGSLFSSETNAILTSGYTSKTFSGDKNGYHTLHNFDFGEYNFNPGEIGNKELILNTKSKKAIKQLHCFFKEKYIAHFYKYLENEKYIIRSFYFRNEWVVLIYDKQKKAQVLLSGFVGDLLNFSTIEFYQKDKIIVIPTEYYLTRMPENCFSILKNRSIADNPVMLKLTLNDDLFNTTKNEDY